jgi:hypothetical protein
MRTPGGATPGADSTRTRGRREATRGRGAARLPSSVNLREWGGYGAGTVTLLLVLVATVTVPTFVWGTATRAESGGRWQSTRVFAAAIAAALAEVASYYALAYLGFGPCGGNGTPNADPGTAQAGACSAYKLDLGLAYREWAERLAGLAFFFPAAAIMVGWCLSLIRNRGAPLAVGVLVAVLPFIVPALLSVVLPDH